MSEVPSIIKRWVFEIEERRTLGYTLMDVMAGYEVNDDMHYELIKKNWPDAIKGKGVKKTFRHLTFRNDY